MVSRANSRDLDDERRVKMTDPDRQSNWTRHLNHSKSTRLRWPLAPNLSECRLSINHNHRKSKQTARHQPHQQQTDITQHNVMSFNGMASLWDKTTSGKEQKISAAARKLSRSKSNKSTATKSMKLLLIFCRPRLAALSIIGISAVLLMLANEFHLTICDTDVRSRSRDAGDNLKSSTWPDKSSLRESDSVGQRSRFDWGGSVELSARSGASTSASSTSSSHKGRILSSLMDSIELQHMKLSPGIRSLALARPSKFDSGSETLREAQSGSLGAARINTRSSRQPSAEAKQHAKTLDDIMNQHYGRGAKRSSTASSSAAGSKADQDLRQIMMLHEQAVNSHTIQSTSDKIDPPQAPTQRHPNLIGKHLARLRVATATGAGSSINTTAKHLWSLAAPTSVGDATKTGKILTGVVSYLGPVGAARKQPQSNLTNPFTPRMSSKSILLGPLMGLGQMFAPDVKQASNKYSLPLFVGSPVETQAGYVLSNAINQPQGYSSSLRGLNKDNKPSGETDKDLVAEVSSIDTPSHLRSPVGGLGSWIKIGANQLAQSHSFQDSFRDLLTLSQLPILLNGPVSTAPSEFEPGGKKHTANRVAQQHVKGANRTQAFDDIFRYAYILGNLAVRRKRDPLKVLGPSPTSNALMLASGSGKNPFWSLAIRPGLASQNQLVKLPPLNLNTLLANRKIKPRGVMWDMATDPSLAVTVFHLLERASVALPLGFLLMPFVHMIRNPLNGINLGRIIPARASHRSVDYEELAKKINNMDKMLSRALRPTHRELPSLPFMKS